MFQRVSPRFQGSSVRSVMLTPSVVDSPSLVYLYPSVSLPVLAHWSRPLRRT
ncbi:hypothetical protein D3C71_1327620 [compost metagenome]